MFQFSFLRFKIRASITSPSGKLRIDPHMNWVTELHSTKLTLMKKLFNLLQNSNSQYRALTKKNTQYQIKCKNAESDSPNDLDQKFTYVYDILQFIDLLYCIYCIMK